MNVECKVVWLILAHHRPVFIMEGLNLKICQNFMWAKIFLTFGGVKILWGGVIFVTTISLFHLFRNSQHPQK